MSKNRVCDAFGLTEDQVNAAIQKLENRYTSLLDAIEPLKEKLENSANRPLDTPTRTGKKTEFGLLLVSAGLSVIGLSKFIPVDPSGGQLGALGGALLLANGSRKSAYQNERRRAALQAKHNLLDSSFKYVVSKDDFFEMQQNLFMADLIRIETRLKVGFFSSINKALIKKYVDTTKQYLSLFEAMFAKTMIDRSELTPQERVADYIVKAEQIAVLHGLKDFWQTIADEVPPKLSQNQPSRDNNLKVIESQRLDRLKVVAAQILPAIEESLIFCSSLNDGLAQAPDLSSIINDFEYVWGLNPSIQTSASASSSSSMSIPLR